MCVYVYVLVVCKCVLRYGSAEAHTSEVPDLMQINARHDTSVSQLWGAGGL